MTFTRTTVGQFCPFHYGKSLPERDRRAGEFPVVSSAGIVGTHDEAFVDGPGVSIGRKGTVGSVTYIPQPFWPIDTAFYIVHDPANRDLRFTYYLLGSLGLAQMNSDSAVPGLNRDNAHSLEIVVPEIEEQRRISGTLGAIDDKIAHNRRLSETLEAIGQALFQSWFVDFEPVRAKASGEAPDAICQRLGLTPELLALFPDCLVNSELGEIPDGWDICPAGRLSEIGIGKTPPRKELEWFSNNPEHYRWISIRDMGQSDAFARQSSETLTPEAVERFNIRRVPDYTVLLSFKLTIGRLAITDGEMTTNEAIAHFKLDAESRVTTEFLYFYLSSFDFDRLGSTSSIAEAVNSRMIRDLPVLVPNEDLITSFSLQARDLLHEIRAIGREADTLVQTRDALLPKLLSGEITVPAKGDD